MMLRYWHPFAALAGLALMVLSAPSPRPVLFLAVLTALLIAVAAFGHWLESRPLPSLETARAFRDCEHHHGSLRRAADPCPHCRGAKVWDPAEVGAVVAPVGLSKAGLAPVRRMNPGGSPSLQMRRHRQSEG